MFTFPKIATLQCLYSNNAFFHYELNRMLATNGIKMRSLKHIRMYHGDKVWEHPKEWKPERFLDENNDSVDLYKMMAFRGGKRRKLFFDILIHGGNIFDLLPRRFEKSAISISWVVLEEQRRYAKLKLNWVVRSSGVDYPFNQPKQLLASGDHPTILFFNPQQIVHTLSLSHTSKPQI
ncbi:hypothetical protein RJ639_010948 [Escallonia herrerae]|uniref:Uncharacterized protein n=1 Tax=Escallonia herrerae TaxID=1293975 RepID=A0AA88VJX2_9ASTE|nr:hypothetical protein RJ639_010948 [Escallonia herrerae]